MGIVSIPAYIYLGTSNYQMDIQIQADNNIIKYFTDQYGYPYSGNIWTASGIQVKNLCTYLNESLGETLPTKNPLNIFARNLIFYGKQNPNENPITNYSKMKDLTGFQLNTIVDSHSVTKIVTLNNFELNLQTADFINSTAQAGGSFSSSCFNGNMGGYSQVGCSTYDRHIRIYYMIYPEGIFTPDGINITTVGHPIGFYIDCTVDSTFEYINWVSVRLETNPSMLTNLKKAFTRDGVEFSTTNSGINEQDSSNPYSNTPFGSSGIGGGDGKYNMDSDAGKDVPDLPDIDAADLGFVTIYSPTKSQLKSLAAFMWSDAFDLNSFKKLFADPMECIIGLAIVPVSPSVGGSKNVMFGSIDTGVNMNYCTSQYVKVDCGSVDIDKYVGSFLDYDYTKISIYLPYIGFRPLDTDDVMGRTISVEYNVDCLSGACAAFISVSGRGVMYSFNGSCISNIPLTANNFSGAIQNAVSAVISGAGVVAGVSSGAAPMTAMGVAGLLSSAANTALNSKPDIQRSGNLGGSAGILSVQEPFIIIQRPDVSVPANVEKYVGQCSNITMSLSECSGFTMVDYVHLHDVKATSEEIKEIEALLKEGVIL